MSKEIIMAFSVPHTGTFFLMKFLDLLGLPALSFDNVVKSEKSRGYLQLHSNHMLINETWKDFHWPDHHAAVIPLRHPHKSFMSHYNEGVKMEWVVMCWETMIEEYPKYDSVVLPIDIEEELRLPALKRVCDFLELEDVDQVVSAYADAWKPLNVTKEDKKILASGDTHDEDLSVLDFAVDWYNDRMNEVYGDLSNAL